MCGLEMLLISKVDEGIEAVDGRRDDIAAAPAVTAVRAAILDELLATKGDDTVAAVTRANIDFGLV
jgi:hypothetical protein